MLLAQCCLNQRKDNNMAQYPQYTDEEMAKLLGVIHPEAPATNIPATMEPPQMPRPIALPKEAKPISLDVQPSVDPFRQEEQRASDKLAQLSTPRSAPTSTLGKIGRGLETAGNIAGNIFAPGTMSLIPGTDLNKQRQKNQAQNELETAGRGELESAEAAKARIPPAKYAFHYTDNEGKVHGIRPDGTDEVMEATAKETNKPEKNFQQVQYSDSTGKNMLGFVDPDNKLWTDENSKGKIDPTTGKDPVIGEPRIIGHAQGKTAATRETATTLFIPGKGKVAGKIDSKGNLLTADDKPAPEGTMLYKPPTYAETMPETRTQVMIDPDTGIASTYSWNPENGKYDIKQGVSGGGQEGSKIAQAAIVQRVGDDVIQAIKDNAQSIDKTQLGTWQAWVEKYGLDTPYADPLLANLQARFMSFAALNPAMHGYRSVDAMHAFEKLVGGLQKNPEAAIASIQGIMQTAAEFNPGGGYKGGGGGKPDKILEKGPDGKLRFKTETK